MAARLARRPSICAIWRHAGFPAKTTRERRFHEAARRLAIGAEKHDQDNSLLRPIETVLNSNGPLYKYDDASRSKPSDNVAGTSALRQASNLKQHQKPATAQSPLLKNLGDVNYRLFLLTGDKTFLQVAVGQLSEQVSKYRQFKQQLITTELSDEDTKVQVGKDVGTKEAISLARLSLCYSAQGEKAKAVDAAREALHVALTLGSPTKVAFERFFLGRALLLDGKVAEAHAQFNPKELCTPLIALCKEPSVENRGFIREILAAGVDIEAQDEAGYTALDWAVYTGDKATQSMLEDALRTKLSGEEIDQLRSDSLLRKGYRELVDKLRPVLLQLADRKLGLHQLRRVYADALAEDKKKHDLFAGLSFVNYNDFVKHGRIPKSTDGLTQVFPSKADDSRADDHVVFVSYKWAQGARITDFSPDDDQNSRYKQMLRALDEYMQLHPTVKPQNLYLWLDWACVEQQADCGVKKGSAARGVAAMSMAIAQCDSMISLVEEGYYDRAWCFAEVFMMQMFQKAYSIHHWYEHVLDPVAGKEILREGTLDEEFDLSSKKLTLEKDRPTLLFLERQARFLAAI